MPERPTSAAHHRRTRRDHAAETAEDYVEAVADVIAERGTCRVTDLSERFGVSHVTVVKAVQRLERDGFLVTEPYRPIELTERGRRLADACRDRHDVVYRFLLALGIDERTAALDAEGIEHHVSDATLGRFRAVADGRSPLPPASPPPPPPARPDPDPDPAPDPDSDSDSGAD